MEINFSKNNDGMAGPALATVENKDELPATVRSDGPTVGDDLPGFRDVVFPRLNIVQNLGELKDQFSPGELVWAQSTVLYSPPIINIKTGNVEKQGTKPINLTVLGVVQKRFHEIISGGIGGQIVGTEAEVRAAGGTLDYREWELKKASGMKRFGPMNDLLVVIERPEIVKDDDTVFGFEVEGKKYALGLWSLQKTSFTEAWKRVIGFHRLAGVLKGGYPTHSFAVSTREQVYPNSNRAWVPVVIPNAKSSPAFLEFVQQILNP